MAAGPTAVSQLVFRPRRVLAVVMGLAGLLWSGVLAYLLTFDGVPTRTLLSTLFFVGFFALSLAYYARTAIVADERGLTYRGVWGSCRVTYKDIRNIDVLPGPITVYSVRAPGRGVHFTSFFANHRGLVSLVVERAGLAPMGS